MFASYGEDLKFKLLESTIEITNFEYMKVILSFHILFYSDILTGDSNYTSKVLERDGLDSLTIYAKLLLIV